MDSMNQGYSAYKTANVETADKGKLIIICYDIAIKHGNLAVEMGSPRANLEQWVKHVYKVQDAISELISALNMDVGEISNNLYRLYEYMLHRLTEAVVKVDAAPVTEVVGYMTDLRGAWQVAIRNVKTGATSVPQSTHKAQAFAFNG